MDTTTQRLIMGAAGAGGAEKIYVEDVFSTWLYAGNNSTQTIANGIDISGKGGLVWIKNRTNSNAHHLFDTTRGATKILKTNSADPQVTDTGTLTGFSSSGFTLSDSTQVNGTNNYASWTFRKQQKFFDVVSWTGDGASSRTISHNLGSTPGFIIIKSVDYSPANWRCWHRSISTGTLNGNDLINLNLTSAANSVPYVIGSVSSTTFEIGNDSSVNQNYYTYVAYLFAHDAGGFGDSGNDSVSACGSFTTDGSGNATITLGWEPQWLLVKANANATNWRLVDTMRGWRSNATNNAEIGINANSINPEDGSLSTAYQLTSTGFKATSLDSSTPFIYIAIRRGPMKTPTDATKVYENVAYTGDQALNRVIGSTVLPDAVLLSDRDATSQGWTTSYAHYFFDRLRGFNTLQTAFTSSETGGWSGYFSFARNIGWDTSSATGNTWLNKTSTKYVSHNFRRAPGFFDVVCYTGTGSNLTVNHNLGVAPELIIWKVRNTSNNWIVGFNFTSTTSKVINLDTTSSSTTRTYPTGEVSTQPTATTVTMGNSNTRQSGDNYVMYLFATLTGISKVGSYTGTGTTLNVDCGFTNGARFVLIKRTDSTGDWYVWDTARGIVSGNDPYLLLNSTAAEVTNTDYIDPLNSGFQISSTAPAAINANGGTFLYLAIA